MAKKKCYICGNTFNASDVNKVLKHWVCDKCVDSYKKSNEYLREKFVDEVWQLYINKKPNYQQLNAQITELISRYQFTLQGLSYALKWYLKNNEWNQQYLLYQAFPQAYYDAQKHYEQDKRQKKSLKQYKKYDKAKMFKASSKPAKPPLPLE